MIKRIEFEALKQAGNIEAFFTPKETGTWNINQPDGPELFKELAQDMGITPKQIVRTEQRHTPNVKVVDMTNGGEGVINPYANNGFDGMITNCKELMLCTVEADCVPVLLYDPVKQVIGNVHSGWRGTVGQISGNAVQLMQERFGTEPADVVAGIGPCICGQCYEVSEDLVGPFAAVYSEAEVKELFLPKGNGKYLLDLKKAITMTLVKAGVKVENIHDSGYCTYHEDLFDSYRKNGGLKLRILSAIMMK